jgi:peptidyl-tRNA hydrolase, PTH2 family
MSYKQAIIVRKDLKMSQGKIAAQSSHSSTEATLKSDPEKVKAWRNEGMKKVILKVNSREELLLIKKEADKQKLTTALIKDAGKTEIKPGTITALGIGPEKEEVIDKVTGKLKLL